MFRVILIAAILIVIVVLCLWPVSPQPTHSYFKDAPQGRAEVIAHGLGQGIRPTNTLSAARAAVSMGTDVLETDIQRTKDGILILLHDDTLDRTTDMTGAVADMSWDEVAQADAGLIMDGYAVTGIGVPRLDDALAAHRDARWIIEIKPGPERLKAAVELCAELRRQEMTRQVMVSSFDDKTIRRFRAACPEVATGMAADEVRNFVIAARLGLSRFVPTPALAMQIPREQSGLNLVHPRIINAAQDRGIRVHVWTINDRAEMEELLALGIDGLITDYVEVARDAIGIED